MRKCSFCDFSVFAVGNQNKDDLIDRYLDVLDQEISLTMDKIDSDRLEPLNTIYLGGGTPSLLDWKQLKYLSSILNRYFDVSRVQEFTIEIMPGTLTKDKLRCFEDIGINRLSMGVQSLNEDDLKSLGRVHTRCEIEKTLDLIESSDKYSGFRSLSLDFLLGIPHQNTERYLQNLEQAIKIKPGHLSVYTLELYESTPFGKKYKEYLPPMPSEDEICKMFDANYSRLSESGYHMYQLSNFALDGSLESKHNKMYWIGDQDYLAFGSGAASMIDGIRTNRPKSLPEYFDFVKSLREITAKTELQGYLAQFSVPELENLSSHLRSVLIGYLGTPSGLPMNKLRKVVGLHHPHSIDSICNFIVAGLDRSNVSHLMVVDSEGIRLKGVAGMLMADEVTTEIELLAENAEKMGLK